MDILTIDFETYYAQDYSLSNMTTEAYVRDPRFEVILASVKVNDNPAFWLPPLRLKEFFDHEIDWDEAAVIAHHAHFDGLILSHHYGKCPAFWIDTLSMARIVDGPKAPNSLEALAIRHGFGEKGTASRWAKGKRFADFTQDELFAYGAYSCNDAELEYMLARKFMPLIPESRLRVVDLLIRMFTEPVFVGNVPLLTEAVVAERERKKAMLAVMGLDKSIFSSNDKFAKLLQTVGVEVPMKASPTPPNGPIPAFAKTDPGMQALLEHEDEVVRFLAQTRLAVKSTIIETRAERFLQCARNGPMPVYLKPFAAHTWRAGGGDSMNWQNMTSINKKRPEMTVLKRAVCAPEGYKVVAADSAQIQARLTAWLAGQADLVEAFAQGRDVYSEAASDIYQRPVDRKKVEADFIPGQVGKITILGFGFGMGWYNAAMEFLKGALGAPPIQFITSDLQAMQIDPSRFLNNPGKVQRVEQMPSRLDLNARLIHCIVADTLVNRWRAKNKKIADLWDTMEGVISAMIRGDEKRFGPNGVLFTRGESIILPSGMTMNYPDIKRDDNGDVSYWDGRKRTYIYGGYMTENMAQGLEAEIIFDNMLELAEAGLRPATMTHDDLVVVVPADVAATALQFMIQTMKRTPAWAPGLPLNAEGGFGDTYAEC